MANIHQQQTGQQDGTRPPIPPRPHEQIIPNQRYQSFVAPGQYGQPSPFFNYPGAHSPFGFPMLASAHQQIDSTFQGIQSIVQAFSSISMMLESTYMAVHSSFRAVMDVADHFVRLKDSLAGVLSLVNIFNTVKWFFKRILYMLNMVSEDQIWSDSLTNARLTIEKGQESLLENKRSNLPMLMFLGVAFGAPYMIYQFQKPAQVSTKWLTKDDCHYIGEALYDFQTDQPNEIPLKAGQRVIIAPKEQQPKVTDWLLASTDGKKSGLIPINYIKITKFEIVE